MCVTAARGAPLPRDWTVPISRLISILGADAPEGFQDLVQDHLDEISTPETLAVLEANRDSWVRLLLRMLDDADLRIDGAQHRLRGPERSMVVADFEREATRIDDVLTSLIGTPKGKPAATGPASEEEAEPADPELQLSWIPGRIIAWLGGPDCQPGSIDEVREALAEAGVSSDSWEAHQSARLPTGGKAESLSVPIADVIGWLVSLGSPDVAADAELGPSARWIGHAAAVAVSLVSQGRMIPQVRKTRRPKHFTEPMAKDAATFVVHWVPALLENETLQKLATGLPPAVSLFGQKQDARVTSHAVVGDLLHSICMTAAERMDVPAAPPHPNSKGELAEAMLAHLGGGHFEAPARLGAELIRRLDQWGKPVTTTLKTQLVVTLEAPDDSNAWYLAVTAANNDGSLEPVESAMVNASNTRRKEARDQLARLERLFPPLLRPGAKRRGEVILSQDEAWQLMTVQGRVLEGAGFEVRVPALSRRKPTPSLRLTSEASESVVGAQQLANVRWSVLFDDLELTAEEIQRLALQARPLVQSHGQWVELDQADLAKAAEALAEREKATTLSGADMLRHALGLEGSPLAGGISISGSGWAADLLRSAKGLPTDLPTQPEGFRGELRSYQADALAWLGFISGAGLGGCLALDMGLGKTPTMLAHLNLTKGDGPSLVIAPPAVVGNWAAEAKKFIPGSRVRVHHGANRATFTGIPDLAKRADIVITTYGTAVRDMAALQKISWNHVVLDEAQAIKNPTSDTAQQLRKLEANSRVALTGTPIENGLGDLWAILDWANPGLVGGRNQFVAQLSATNAGNEAEGALRALNGIMVFRRTKAEPSIAAELPDRIDELDYCAMTPEQIGLYQAVLDSLVAQQAEVDAGAPRKKGAVLAAITALKQICNHPVNYRDDAEGEDLGLDDRSGKLARLIEIMDTVFAAGEKILIFTHFASWGEVLAKHLSKRFGKPISCYHGGLARGARDRMVDNFQEREGAGALVLSLKAGGTGLNLTAANHVVLYDRWWNPAVEDQARDRVWRIGQKNTVVCHRLVCPGTVDERVEEVVAGKRKIADMVLPKSSSIEDLDANQLQAALGIDPEQMLSMDDVTDSVADAANDAGSERVTNDQGGGAPSAGAPVEVPA